jgi:Na+-driven multidrug efflux pump
MKRSQLLSIGVVIIFGPPAAIGFVVGHFWGLWGGIAAAVFSLGLVLTIAYYWVMRHTKSNKGEKPND